MTLETKTTNRTCDLVVIGGGTIGLSAAYHGATRGLDTILIDQFPNVNSGSNDSGSSRGLERMFRILYAQTKRVRLVETAYAMWHELQQHSISQGYQPILAEQDMLFFGNNDVTTFEGNISEIKNSMNQLGIPYDELSNPKEIAERYPIFNEAGLCTPDGTPYIGLVQNNGATINVQRAFEVTRELAERTNRYQQVEGLAKNLEQHTSGSWTVTLNTGETIDAAYLILCPGVWLDTVLAPLGLAAFKGDPAWSIWQMTLAFFEPGPAGQGAHWPIWYEFGNTKSDSRLLFYGFPDVGFSEDTKGKFKISSDYTNRVWSSTDQIDRSPDPKIVEDIQNHLRKLCKPGILNIDNPQYQQACMYSMAPDGDMVIGRIPMVPEGTEFRTNSSILCMASGRGFKYTPLFGRILVDLAVTGSTTYQSDLGDFSPTRAHVFQTT